MSKSNKELYPALNVIGLMSGTSVDSIDAACIRVQLQRSPLRLAHLEILGTATTEFDEPVKGELMTALNESRASLETICRLHARMGMLFAQTAVKLIADLKCRDIRADLVASHGQTLYHIPPSADAPGSTLQIGDPSVIAEQTGLEVIADFRPGDIAAGGHGAPLAPFADMLLFQDKEIPRAVHNIGGISNLTVLPALNDTENRIMAFDTGPGNMLIDTLTQLLFDLPYDKDGEIAQMGGVRPAMMDELMAQPYLALPPPKSTGRELFGRKYAESFLSRWQDKFPREDIIATATHFTAITITDAYDRFVLPKVPLKEVILGGGGVFNQTLKELIEERFLLYGIELKTHEDFGIHSKYKEAIAFALLGYARKLGIPANIPECTGAAHPVILGGSWLAS